MPAPGDSTIYFLGSPSARRLGPRSRRPSSVNRPFRGVVVSLTVLALITVNAFSDGGLWGWWGRCFDSTGGVEELSARDRRAAPSRAVASVQAAAVPTQGGQLSPPGDSSHLTAASGKASHVPALTLPAVVLNVSNRPDLGQEGQFANPADSANPSASGSIPVRNAVSSASLPILTPQQAQQIFDPTPAETANEVAAGAQALSRKAISTTDLKLGRPFVRRIPWTTFPLSTTVPETSTTKTADSIPPSAISAESELWNSLPSDEESLPLESSSAVVEGTDSEVTAPLVPLVDGGGTNQLPDVRSELPPESPAPESPVAVAVVEPQLAPSEEITPLQPLRPKLLAQPASATRPEPNGSAGSERLVEPENRPRVNPSPASKTSASGSAATPWPQPGFLLNRVAEVRAIPGLEPWVQETSLLLLDLQAVPALSDQSVVAILGELERQTLDLEPLVVRFSTVPASNADEALGPESVTLRRLAYKLRQQIDVWYAAHEMAVRNFHSLGDFDSPAIARGLDDLRQRLARPGGNNQDWQRYLTIEQVVTALNDPQASPLEKRAAARRFLSRLHSPILSQPQREFLAGHVAPRLVEQLKVAAREEINLEQLLMEIEALQGNRNGVAQHRVNQMFQNLAWQDDPAARELAATIDTHFRNANFRVSVSDEMLNLLLPDLDETDEPVNENVLGAAVRGQSRVANRLQIRLIPDTSRIQMRLEAIGKVLSQTEAQRSGFTIQNVGDARFQVFKRLAIGREGIMTGQPEAWSRSSNRMVGMQSELDGVPVLGWVARRIAERKIAEQSPAVERYTRRKLETAVKQRFDSQIEEQLSQMQEYLHLNMLQPLTALELEPTPLEMRSTDRRVIMRYRLAGFDQMGGSTARPRGLQNSLLSMQIHETSINNLLSRIDLNGAEFTTDELTRHLATVFGWQSDATPQAREATFEFAHFDPIRVTFSQGSAAVQLNLKRLRVGNGKTWKNLTATCNFIPQAEGGKVIFVQDGSGIELSGHRLGLRDQVAVRAIFTALFKDQYELPILPKNIAQKLGPTAVITQLELNDGWIGLSVDKRENLTPQRISELEAARTGNR